MAGGPSVDRTLTGGGETLALTLAQVTEEPRWDPTMVESFTPRVRAFTQDSKVERSSDGQGRPPIIPDTAIKESSPAIRLIISSFGDTAH